MDRGIPTANKLVSKKINDRNRQIHLLKLNTIKSSISRVPPQSFAHMKSNKKKIQVTEDKLTQIEKENKLLLDKLTVIMKSAYTNQPTERVASRSLNRDSRKRDLVKITIENQAFSKRLQDKKSEYDRGVWENGEKQRERYLKNISEYPFVLLEGKLKHEDRPHSFQLSRGDLPSFLNSPGSLSSKLNTTTKDPNVNDQNGARKSKNEKLTPVSSSTSQQMLFHTKRKIGLSNYLIHIYFHNEVLNIIASNNERTDLKTLSLPRKEGEQLIALFEGNYEALLDQIQFKGPKIVLKNTTATEQTNKNSVFYGSNLDIVEAHDENELEGSADLKQKVGKNQEATDKDSAKRNSESGRDKPHVVEVMKKEQKKAQIKSQTEQTRSVTQDQSQIQAKSETSMGLQAQSKAEESQSEVQNPNQEQGAIKASEDSKEQKQQNEEQLAQNPSSSKDGNVDNDQKQDKEEQTKKEEDQNLKQEVELKHEEEVKNEVKELANTERKELNETPNKDKAVTDNNSAKEAVIADTPKITPEKVQQNPKDEPEKPDHTSEVKESVNMEGSKSAEHSEIDEEKIDQENNIEDEKQEEQEEDHEDYKEDDNEEYQEDDVEDQAANESNYSEDFDEEGKHD